MTNRTVQLVQEWVNFESKHPTGTLEDFCRHVLSEKDDVKPVKADLSCSSDYRMIYSLTRVINRLSRLWMYFTLQAIRPMGLSSFEEFGFLYTVDQSKTIRKKDLIYMHFMESSSGLLVIDRLIKKGFLKEKTNQEDKRSKQVFLTQKGHDVLKKCDVALSKVAENLYSEMPEKDMQSCIRHLSLLENRIARKWHEIKKFEPVTIVSAG
jgi:DNA-binding MarR family transcriptional regulator